MHAKNKGGLPATDPCGDIGGLCVLCVTLESQMLRQRAVVTWRWLAKGGPSACRQQDTLRCDK